VPPVHFFEQQSPSPTQVLPAVLHDVFSVWQTPFVQLVEQQGLPPPVHAWPSERQAAAPHVPFDWQLRLQQSVAFWHGSP